MGDFGVVFSVKGQHGEEWLQDALDDGDWSSIMELIMSEYATMEDVRRVNLVGRV